MTGMHRVLAGVTAAALVAGAVTGAAVVATGWVPPWGGSRIMRPRLWGHGTLVGAVGMSGYAFLGPLNGAPFAHMPLAAMGFGLYPVGTATQLSARRPGRARDAAATKNAS
ncbi:hypothetical protein [Streptomyces sp. NPDC093984]|uniref:hypothetical protein n=1 Tax=Streptomyces sp. NPDC093984 TaxID=3366052 RepID=UPI003822DE2A